MRKWSPSIASDGVVKKLKAKVLFPPTQAYKDPHFQRESFGAASWRACALVRLLWLQARLSPTPFHWGGASFLLRIPYPPPQPHRHCSHHELHHVLRTLSRDYPHLDLSHHIFCIRPHMSGGSSRNIGRVSIKLRPLRHLFPMELPQLMRSWHKSSFFVYGLEDSMSAFYGGSQMRLNSWETPDDLPGDVRYISNVSIIFDCLMILYYQSWILFIKFHIIFGD